MKSNNRVVVEVNLSKVKSNFQKICKSVAPGKVTAVLKANAYGLGVKEVAKVCVEAGADSFGVADVNEALELKSMGLPVMVLGNILPDEIPTAVAGDIIMPVNEFAGAQRISTEAVKQNKTVQYQILIDSGMGRLGLLIKKAHREIKKMIELPNIECIGIYSHFPVAENPEDEYIHGQIESFQSLIKDLEVDGISFENIHTANSDAINNYPQAYKEPFNRVRLGLNIYGCSDPQTLGLDAVVSFKAKLVLVRELPAGAFIGYGKTHCLEKDTLVATVAAGYADGVPLALSNCGHVLIRGKKCPIIGRVSMDYTTIDLSQVPDAECGDEVVYIGIQGNEEILLQNWADMKKAPYQDILCAISSRAKCVYIK